MDGTSTAGLIRLQVFSFTKAFKTRLMVNLSNYLTAVGCLALRSAYPNFAWRPQLIRAQGKDAGSFNDVRNKKKHPAAAIMLYVWKYLDKLKNNMNCKTHLQSKIRPEIFVTVHVWLHREKKTWTTSHYSCRSSDVLMGANYLKQPLLTANSVSDINIGKKSSVYTEAFKNVCLGGWCKLFPYASFTNITKHNSS